MLAARIGDMHVCPMVTPGVPPIPHVGGPILPPCSVTVLTGSIPQARITDLCVCVGPPDTIVLGCPTVLVNNLMAARLGDMCAHGGTIVAGLPTVIIGSGGAGGASGGGGGMGMGVPGSATSAITDFVATADTSIAPAQQAGVYKNAAKTGAAFCERCQA